MGNERVSISLGKPAILWETMCGTSSCTPRWISCKVQILALAIQMDLAFSA